MSVFLSASGRIAPGYEQDVRRQTLREDKLSNGVQFMRLGLPECGRTRLTNLKLFCLQAGSVEP